MHRECVGSFQQYFMHYFDHRMIQSSNENYTVIHLHKDKFEYQTRTYLLTRWSFRPISLTLMKVYLCWSIPAVWRKYNSMTRDQGRIQSVWHFW